MSDYSRRWGEYYNPEDEAATPRKDVKALKDENRHQNERLAYVEREVRDMRVALVGIDDRNGLRGELRQYQYETRESLAAINAKLEGMVKTMLYVVFGVIGASAGLAGLVFGAIRALGG